MREHRPDARYRRVVRWRPWLGLILYWSAVARGEGGERVIASRDYRVQLTPDLQVFVGQTVLEIRSHGTQASLPLMYGTSSTGAPNAIDHAGLAPNGAVTLYFRNECLVDSPAAASLQQTTSLNALRARVLMRQADQHATLAAAKAQIERANALDPMQPAAAVSRARRVIGSPRQATELLSPALASAPYETYFEVLRRAPLLKALPLFAQLRARAPARARFDGNAEYFAVHGSLVALTATAENEADCASASELILLDSNTAQVVFRHLFSRQNEQCVVKLTDVALLDQMLSDLGFEPTGDSARAEGSGGSYALELAVAHRTLTIDATEGSARLSQTAHPPAETAYHGDAPRRAYLLPGNRVAIVETNRDSDVCEGLPSFEVLRW